MNDTGTTELSNEAALEARSHGTAVERVDYEFQKGGHSVLRVER